MEVADFSSSQSDLKNLLIAVVYFAKLSERIFAYDSFDAT